MTGTPAGADGSGSGCGRMAAALSRKDCADGRRFLMIRCGMADGGTELLSVILETHKPVDVVVLMLGTNDCKTMYDTSAEVIGRGVERLLDQIRSSTPDSKILLMSPIALGEGVGEAGIRSRI